MKSEKINICFEALDKNINQFENDVALRCIPKSWSASDPRFLDVTYLQLIQQSIQFANILKSLGAIKGDVLFTLTPSIPEIYTVAFGALRSGVVFAPLFSMFGPEPILTRINKGDGKILFTLSSIYKKKILPHLSHMPSLTHIILLDDDGLPPLTDKILNFHKLMEEASNENFFEDTTSEDIALLHFTSGTTGEPKGAIHVHGAVKYHSYSGSFALDIKRGDLFWCTADPGWVTGTSYGIISPLCNGATILVDSSDFNAERWYEILSFLKVTNWYTAPTALRMLMRAGDEIAKSYDFSSVRFASSVGEPLNPEVIKWVNENLHIMIHDNWWQTETGGILIGNFVNQVILNGSMGKAVPGIDIKLIKEIKDGKIIFSDIGENGEIAVRKGWDSMFRGYLKNPDRYQECFFQDWYLSGDLAKIDENGYYWFIGRKDDVIKTSGHLVGPFEIENILMEEPSILESAVIGLPDSMVGEKIKAFVVLKNGFFPEEGKKRSILAYARNKLGAAISPREIEFVNNLPKTKSGKIMRRLLKSRELGLPEGDLSTLEGAQNG